MIKAANWFLSARISRFALIGAFGTVINVLLMMALVGVGVDYIVAAIVAGETTIVSNFIMQEKFAFADKTDFRKRLGHRFFQSFTFNTAEALARVPFLWILVEVANMLSPVAQAVTILAAFFLRYLFHVKLVYAPQAPAKAVSWARDSTPSLR